MVDSKYFAGTDSNEIGRYLLSNVSSSALKIGTTWANFQEHGKIPVDKNLLKITCNRDAKLSTHLAKNSTGIESGPVPLLTSRLLNLSNTASRVTKIDVRHALLS